MGRPEYVSLYADKRTQRIFDDFVRIKGITKSTALSEMMEIYMLSQDEELYTELKKKYLGVNIAKQEILERTDTRSVNDYIFMKLSTSYDVDGNPMDGHDTISSYQNNAEKNGFGYTWFSTDSLSTGMAKKKIVYYNQLAERGEKVTILFAVADEENDICYTATVLEIQSSREHILCPGDAACVPDEFGKNERAKIWVKMKDIKEEHDLKAEMFRVRTTDSNLKQIISTSQFHFGYVYLPEDDERK